jgi:K+-sensing histidine kinase KdpD
VLRNCEAGFRLSLSLRSRLSSTPILRRSSPAMPGFIKSASLEQVGDVEPQEAELQAARWSLATGTVARSGVYPNLASRFDFWPVETAEGQNAVIGLAFDPDERPSAPDALVNIVVRVLALVLDRQHVRRQTHGSASDKSANAILGVAAFHK